MLNEFFHDCHFRHYLLKRWDTSLNLWTFYATALSWDRSGLISKNNKINCFLIRKRNPHVDMSMESHPHWLTLPKERKLRPIAGSLLMI